MMILRIAENEDLNTLISWIKDKEACKRWAGPLVRFPFTLNVYTNNTTAVKLYRKLGFKPKSALADAIADDEIVHMVLTPDGSGKLT